MLKRREGLDMCNERNDATKPAPCTSVRLCYVKADTHTSQCAEQLTGKRFQNGRPIYILKKATMEVTTKRLAQKRLSNHKRSDLPLYKLIGDILP